MCGEKMRALCAPIAVFASRRVTEEPAIFVSAVIGLRIMSALRLAFPPAPDGRCEIVCEAKRLVTASTC